MRFWETVRVRFAGAGAVMVRVKFFAHFGQCQKVQNLKMYSTNHIQICHFLAEAFAFKVLLKTFDTFSSHVMGI